MKVAFLSGYPFEEYRYGVSEHIFQLSRALGLSPEVDSCHVISMYDKTRSWMEYPKVWSHTIKKEIYHYLFPWSASTEIDRLVHEINPDLIHLHCATLPYTWAAQKLSKQFPVVVTIHSDVAEEALYKPFKSKLWDKTITIPLMNRAVKNLDTVIVPSQEMKRRISRLQNNRIYVIPNGTNIKAHFDNNLMDHEGFSYILFMGRLCKEKGLDVLIRALPKIIQIVGPTLLIVAGSGNDQKNLVDLVKEEKLEDLVRFLGFLSGEKKEAILQRSSLVVVPSRYESFGIILLEAMAYGKPVVASRIGGIPEIVRDRETGLLFEVGDVTGLADRIIELIEKPDLRKKIGDAGRKLAERYSWSVIADQTIALYQDCINFKVIS